MFRHAGNAWSAALLALAIAAFLAVSLRYRVRENRAVPTPSSFRAACCSWELNVLGHYYFNFRVIGEPQPPDSGTRSGDDSGRRRVAAAIVELARAARRARLARALAVAVVLFGVMECAPLSSAMPGSLYPREPDYRQRVEYRMSDWMAGHLPRSAHLVSGSVRFWWDTWHDLAQVGGGSEQGLLNRRVMPAQWEVHVGTDPELAVRWLTALGADAVIVSDQHSQEIYHDFKAPG